MTTLDKSKIVVVIPAINEAATINRVVHSVISEGYSVVVIDDGSTDNTVELAEQAGAVVLRHIYNLGAWKAMQTGFRYAVRCDAEAVVTMDADEQHPVSEIDKLLESYCAGADIVIGNCTKRGSLGRHIAWQFFKRINGFSISDITSGFRLYSRGALDCLVSRQATMLEYQCVGVLIMLRNMKLSITEVSVNMQERTDGASRIFYSWGAVAKYLAYSMMLSLTKAFPTKKNKYHQRIVRLNHLD